MNEAIKLAIEKGGFAYPEKKDYYESDWNRIILRPDFWQALAKAIGEEKKMYWLTPAWQYHSHRYFDLVMANGDTEKFWKELINA